MRCQVKHTFLEVIEEDTPSTQTLLRSRSADQLCVRTASSVIDFTMSTFKEASSTTLEEDKFSQVVSQDQNSGRLGTRTTGSVGDVVVSSFSKASTITEVHEKCSEVGSQHESVGRLDPSTRFSMADFDDKIFNEASSARLVEDTFNQQGSQDQMIDDVSQHSASSCSFNWAMRDFDEGPSGSQKMTRCNVLDAAIGPPTQLPHLRASASNTQAAKEVLEAFVTDYRERFKPGPKQAEGDQEQTQGDQDLGCRIQELLQQLCRKEEQPDVMPFSWQSLAHNKEQSKAPKVHPQDEMLEEAKSRYWRMLVTLKAQLEYPH